MPSLISRMSRFRASRRGNVAMIYALTAPIVVFGIAIAIDFTEATVVRSKLNAAADAASLAALTPAMMQQTDAVAQTAAEAMFIAQADAIGSLSGQMQYVAAITGPDQFTVAVTDPNGTGSRQVAVTYSANTNAIFSGILHTTMLNVAGTSTANASTPPNINFYLLLDNSPSMALPFDQTSLNKMQNLTSTQDQNAGVGGTCAFACHQASTNNTDTMGNPCSDGSLPTLPYNYSSNGTNYSIPNSFCPSKGSSGNAITQLDNFALARKNGVTLRLDELTTGVGKLMSTAWANAHSGLYSTPPQYTFTAYSLDSLWTIGDSAPNNGANNYSVMGLTSDYVNQWNLASANFGVMEMYANNTTCGDAACDTGGNQGDVATNYDNAFNSINNAITTIGNGTNQTGDKPQAVVFFVTDGVEDETTSGSCSEAWSGNRCQAPINPDLCTTLKNRGIKIAVLYTEYLPVTSNSWYNEFVGLFQTSIGTQLKTCASPGLYYDAAIGTDLGQALGTLFNIAANQAALSN